MIIFQFILNSTESVPVINGEESQKRQQAEQEQRAERSIFVQELLFSTLEKNFADQLEENKLDLGPD